MEQRSCRSYSNRFAPHAGRSVVRVDLPPAGMTIKRPRGSAVQPRTELALSFSLPGSHEEISARGLVVTDASVGSFRRTGVRFIALRPEHAQLIAGYCRRRRS